MQGGGSNCVTYFSTDSGKRSSKHLRHKVFRLHLFCQRKTKNPPTLDAVSATLTASGLSGVFDPPNFHRSYKKCKQRFLTVWLASNLRTVVSKRALRFGALFQWLKFLFAPQNNTQNFSAGFIGFPQPVSPAFFLPKRALWTIQINFSWKLVGISE